MSDATSDLEAARIEMESLFGETAILDGVSLPVIVPTQGIAQTLAAGAFIDGKTGAVSIRKSLLAAAPIIGTSKATVRGSDWRVARVDANLVTYEITLQSLNR
ncbi:hypothetical protein SAMN05444156_3226 [Verrucomicrobium sp. GAS474]|uniref:hypothetical protein n=1 Tax=Verrucomicrobium sp. GAS474 TaxID=1882831 RepID=UPI00087BEEE8|nr:hypothetical protein [Verrucomicrobium sp. GAS474]SDU31185.1 hypothetical protein SAMN05444156_3226 [Verrucomicrobium sp. GAS474]